MATTTRLAQRWPGGGARPWSEQLGLVLAPSGGAAVAALPEHKLSSLTFHLRMP